MATPSSASSSRRSHREGDTRELTIGNFTRLGQIGQGSFATVYKAKHVKRGTLVAIKSVILSRLNKKLKDNLFTEIHILRELHHPHIVGLFDCRETAVNIHLVMEYCPMGDLAYFMRKREQFARHDDFVRTFQKYPNPKAGGLHEVVARHFFQQLCSALAFLRSKDLIHRDVKPQNLLIVPPRSYYDAPRHDTPYFPSAWTIPAPVGIESLPVLKLADFGFARSLPKTTLAETLCGSPLYMAPEILRYEKYDAKADLWSVGTVTYELLTGKPPFRAANHIELLRKIENAQDNIKFPDEPVISPDMRRVVCALLKRGPVERISFAEFFDDPTVKDVIPGMAEEDRRRFNAPKTLSVSASSSVQTAPMRTPSAAPEPQDSDSQEKFHDAVDYPSQQRPPLRDAATAPAGQLPRTERTVVKNSSPPVSPSNMPPPSVPASAMRRDSLNMRRTSSRDQTPTIQERLEAESVQERAAQEVAFERDYVLVEKRAVEVNAFADEMAASPRVARPGRRDSNSAIGMTRRNTTQNTPPQTGGNGGPSARAGGPARRPEHLRQDSLEKRARNATSTTSAISKAVALASGRLFSLGISPPVSLPLSQRATPSPPVYGPFPSYPSTGHGILSEGKGTADEDTKVLQSIEEAAHRSDVVFGFAEVKYKQLIPSAPSVSGDGLGLRQAGIPSKEGPEDEDVLTADAMVQLSEEAFVLYVKSLSLLAHAMDVAGTWWAKKHNSEGGEASSAPVRPAAALSSAAVARMNRVVQWVRDRFNEVLEKAEFVRLKLVAAQKRLPPDHPAHPSHHPRTATPDEVHLTPGVSAEKLMYVRALEMGKNAAVNELVCDDLPGCEIAYVTAIRMLEAVLDTEDAALPGRVSMDADGERVVEAADRAQIRKVVQGFHSRLQALRSKLHVLAERQAAAGSSGNPTAVAGSAPAGSHLHSRSRGGSSSSAMRSPAPQSPAPRSPVPRSPLLAGGAESGSPRSR